MRRQFTLPESDVEVLDHNGWEWETLIEEDRHRWLLIHHYDVPEGYDHRKATLALRIDAGYPTSQIDMAYFLPHLSRSDGKVIGALAYQPLDDQTYQRWSRHRSATNPWRPGVDDISTHLGLVDYWLKREFDLR